MTKAKTKGGRPEAPLGLPKETTEANAPTAESAVEALSAYRIDSLESQELAIGGVAQYFQYRLNKAMFTEAQSLQGPAKQKFDEVLAHMHCSSNIFLSLVLAKFRVFAAPDHLIDEFTEELREAAGGLDIPAQAWVDIANNLHVPKGAVAVKGGLKVWISPKVLLEAPLKDIETLICHEALHVWFLHMRLRNSSNTANDLAINSQLDATAINSLGGIMPGDGALRNLEKYQKDFGGPNASLLAKKHLEEVTKNMKLYASMPMGLTSEEYQSLLPPQKKGDGGDGNTMDIHIDMDDLSPGEKDQLEAVLRNAAVEGSRGHSPTGSICNLVRELAGVPKPRNLRQLLAPLVASMRSVETNETRKKVNRRSPMAAGAFRMPRYRICVGVDQSGSMSDEQVGEVFGILHELSPMANITYLPFDTKIGKPVEVKRGKPMPPRTMQGGTDFDCVTQYVNDHAREYDALMILTDGYVGDTPPIACKKRRYWVMCKGGELSFPTKEPVVKAPVD